MSENTETAILAGGCCWITQELMRHCEGVITIRAGWTGGESDNPTEDEPGGTPRRSSSSSMPPASPTVTSSSSSSRSTAPTSVKASWAPSTAQRSFTRPTSSARSPRTRSPTSKPQASGPRSRPRSARPGPSWRPRPKIRTTSSAIRTAPSSRSPGWQLPAASRCLQPGRLLVPCCAGHLWTPPPPWAILGGRCRRTSKQFAESTNGRTPAWRHPRSCSAQATSSQALAARRAVHVGEEGVDLRHLGMCFQKACEVPACFGPHFAAALGRLLAPPSCPLTLLTGSHARAPPV